MMAMTSKRLGLKSFNGIIYIPILHTSRENGIVSLKIFLAVSSKTVYTNVTWVSISTLGIYSEMRAYGPYKTQFVRVYRGTVHSNQKLKRKFQQQ